ncbi:GGDEF domain-containing protein [Arenimonas sp.]|uniref:GGDEF domain-containing protein n=1 Tax=Arenimonas sp. TaxID=1872635 RepID=UPI0039E3CA58
MRKVLQRMRTDFQLAIITSLGFCAVLGIIPFSIYRFLSGNAFAGVVDLLISVGIVVAVLNAWKSGNVKRAGLLLAIVNTAGCLLSASVLGPPGQYWMYPALVGNFLLLDRKQALLLTASALVFLTVQGKAYDSRLQLVMFLVSASVTSMIAFVFASRTDTQRQQLEALATLDPLTGTGNRRAMVRELQLAVESFKRTGSPFGLAMLDLDHFKQINDKHGHECGDEVLVDFAELVRQHTRKVDRCFRFGGEEFVLLMPSTDVEALRVIDSHLREYVAGKLRCREEQVTVSIGAAALRKGEDWQAWLARADAALYCAKHEGRNCTVVDA